MPYLLIASTDDFPVAGVYGGNAEVLLVTTACIL